jgi:hypothetical protein
MGCDTLNASLHKTIKFKIILTILAHGSCQNLCVEPMPYGNEYLDNFETSDYSNKISLYSMVPYGINNVSASYGEGSRKNKIEFISKMYELLEDNYDLYINKPITSHVRRTPREKELSFKERDKRLLNDYSLTDYDIIIDTILHTFSGSYTAANLKAALDLTRHDDKVKGSKKADYLKSEVAKSRDFIEPQVIVKEKYHFSKYVLNPANEIIGETPEFSGIYGIRASYNYVTMKDESIQFDFTNLVKMAERCAVENKEDVIKTIYNYIENWNEYIKTLYEDKDKNLFELNTIQVQPDTNENPVRIIKINTQSLYHIIFLYLNGLENTAEYIEAAIFLQRVNIIPAPDSGEAEAAPMSGDTVMEEEAETTPGSGETVMDDAPEETYVAAVHKQDVRKQAEAARHEAVIATMEKFLNYINGNLNIDLYLISYACRGARGDSEKCSLVNTSLQEQQQRLRCKKEGLNYFRLRNIRKARHSSRYRRDGGSRHTTKKHKKSKRRLSKRRLSKK